MFLKRSEESYGNVRFNGEKVDFDSFGMGLFAVLARENGGMSDKICIYYK